MRAVEQLPGFISENVSEVMCNRMFVVCDDTDTTWHAREPIRFDKEDLATGNYFINVVVMRERLVIKERHPLTVANTHIKSKKVWVVSRLD